MWHDFFFALSALICLGSLLATLYAAIGVRVGWESLQRQVRSNESAVRLIDTTLQELSEAQAMLANSHKMSKVRKALTHTDRKADSEPDPKLDPEGWRAWMNGRLRLGPQ